MPPFLGLVVWAGVGLVLLRWSKGPGESRALWVPVIWLSMVSSRLPSQWLGLNPTSLAAAFEEGSALDRVIYVLLILAGFWILRKRQLKWADLFARNSILILLLAFALASVIWSDFSYISFKRWIRDLDLYVMVLVVLSEPRPLVAISTVLRRFSYILLFSSFILVKYYPYLGIVYDQWLGQPEYIGATTSKNMLGIVCLISGLFYFWDTLSRWPQRKTREAKLVLFTNIVLIAITLRLLSLSNSATSQGCFVMGCLLIAIARTNWAKVNPRRVTTAIPFVLVAYIVLEFAFDLSATVAEFMGRDPTLHGRTGIWSVVLNMQTNPLLGVGYQSFWMGARMEAVWRNLNSGFGALNEAHNGYLETYLNLGFIGVALLAVFLISSYRTVCRRLIVSWQFASFGLTLWVVAVFYNFTESAFGASLLWFVLLLSVVVVHPSDEILPEEAKPAVKWRQATGLRYANGSGSNGVRSLGASGTLRVPSRTSWRTP